MGFLRILRKNGAELAMMQVLGEVESWIVGELVGALVS
jgi:hypothetical protein